LEIIEIEQFDYSGLPDYCQDLHAKLLVALQLMRQRGQLACISDTYRGSKACQSALALERCYQSMGLSRRQTSQRGGGCILSRGRFKDQRHNQRGVVKST
jgi:hypothetical protein